VKSERIRKFESELADLEQWLKLGLVPKKDLEKHKIEIDAIRKKINDESERLLVLKESGDQEEFQLPKRSQPVRASYQETNTIAEESTTEETSSSDSGLDLETESFDADTSTKQNDEGTTKADQDDDGEDPFSDKNRWKRGILEDPDLDQW
jgi:hypothetical protein